MDQIQCLKKYKLPLLIAFMVLLAGIGLYAIIGNSMSEKWLSQAWKLANEQGHVTKITDESIELIHREVRKAAFFGNAEAELYSNIPSAKSFQSILRKAERGDVYAQFAVGFFLRFSGTFLDKLKKEDYNKAEELNNWLRGQRVGAEIVEYMWFLKAAEQGHPRAQQFSALYPEEKKKYEEFQRDQEAADHGDPEAMYAMGLYYTTFNSPVYENEQKAFQWVEKAAEAGCAKALCALAEAYIKGFGNITIFHLEYNPEKAVALFRKAADLGNIDAYYGLGRCYEEGRGVKRNLEEAEKWLEKAVASGGGGNAYQADNHLKSVRYKIWNERQIKRRY